ncbi:hypothetical protein M9H77_36606 [Catharanthus roseus]|uniref:Uncharacterized protein n=1 Tax=Catharanthus roseus TaxID=4058 RepID=A0ACB9ZS89_CATRO|nr:hypothetical protein M9H77_36606 [Catharanthus roseus]
MYRTCVPRVRELSSKFVNGTNRSRPSTSGAKPCDTRFVLHPIPGRVEGEGLSKHMAGSRLFIEWEASEDKFGKLKEQKEHKHKMMLELNEEVKKRHIMASAQQSLPVCTLNPSMLLLEAAHSFVVMSSIWPPSVVSMGLDLHIYNLSSCLLNGGCLIARLMHMQIMFRHYMRDMQIPCSPACLGIDAYSYYFSRLDQLDCIPSDQFDWLPYHDQVMEDSNFWRAEIFDEHCEKAQSCINPLPKRVFDKFMDIEVKSLSHIVVQFNAQKGIYKVNSGLMGDGRGDRTCTLRMRSNFCTSRKWQVYILPCSHSFAV